MFLAIALFVAITLKTVDWAMANKVSAIPILAIPFIVTFIGYLIITVKRRY